MLKKQAQEAANFSRNDQLAGCAARKFSLGTYSAEFRGLSAVLGYGSYENVIGGVITTEMHSQESLNA